jgi:hypothetical protein
LWLKWLAERATVPRREADLAPNGGSAFTNHISDHSDFACKKTEVSGKLISHFRRAIDKSSDKENRVDRIIPMT